MQNYTYNPIEVTVNEKSYLLTMPWWSFGKADATALGLNARLITAEEAADNPQVLQHLVKIGFGGIKPINKN